MPSSDDAATLKALIDGVDHAARQAESKWGLDRLPLLVSDELRAKFYRNRTKWSDALAAAYEAKVVSRDLLDEVIRLSGSMQRAWTALDAHATTSGHTPSQGAVLAEIRMPDGSVAAIVEDAAEASLVLGHRSYQAVYSLTEIANIIGALPAAITAAKREWPKGEIMRPRSSKPPNDRLDDLPEPFGDAA